MLSAELFDATNPIESPFLNRLLELLRFQYAPLPRQSCNVTRPQNATCHAATRGAPCGPMRQRLPAGPRRYPRLQCTAFLILSRFVTQKEVSSAHAPNRAMLRRCDDNPYHRVPIDAYQRIAPRATSSYCGVPVLRSVLSVTAE